MRNNFKNYLSILFFSILSFTTIHATTTTWLGGIAAWNDPGQWDTGTVPTYGDEVIIPGGRAYVYAGDYASATSVEVRSGGRLYVQEDGALEIQGAVDQHGLHNMGRVYVRGALMINSVTQTSANTADAIYNQAFIFTYSNSEIYIKYIDGNGIKNNSYSYFRSRGIISIYSTGEKAIYNEDRFYNSGKIAVKDCGASSSFAVVNIDNFRNYSTGEISVDSDIYGGFSNTGSNGHLRNYGLIEINQPTVGLNNSRTVTNESGATIEVKNAGIGFYNRSGRTINNYGSLKAKYCGDGFNNYGIINNYRALWVFDTSANGSLRNFSGGVVNNYSDIYLSSSFYRDIWNYGEINNHPGGIIEVNKVIDISTGGSLINDGFVVSHSEYNHVVTGSFTNNGAIDDNYGTFPATVNNQEVIIAPVSGMTEGVPFSNVLDVVALTDISIEDWKTSPGGVIAGTYDETTNEFTPNASAVGLTTLYISIQENISGFGRWFTLEIDGGILAAGGGSSMVIQNTPVHTANDKEVRTIDIFPNPSNGTVQIKSESFETEETQVQVFNTLGQLVQQGQLGEGAFTQKLNFSSQLVNGIYLIKLIQNGKELSTQRIQLQR